MLVSILARSRSGNPTKWRAATGLNTYATEAEAKAFFQGVSSISNVLVSVDSLKVEARVAGADVLNWSAMFFKMPYSTATFVPF
jgi:hypothetical protein